MIHITVVARYRFIKKVITANIVKLIAIIPQTNPSSQSVIFIAFIKLSVMKKVMNINIRLPLKENTHKSNRLFVNTRFRSNGRRLIVSIPRTTLNRYDINNANHIIITSLNIAQSQFIFVFFAILVQSSTSHNIPSE